MKANTVKTKGVGAMLSLDLWSRFKVHCTMNNVKQGELITQLIINHLDKGAKHVSSNTRIK